MNRLLIIVSSYLLACVYSPSLFAEKAALTPEKLHQELDSKAPEWLIKHSVPSVGVAYIQAGKLHWSAAYGEQSQDVPATEKTLYNIASMSKPISAEVILRLASLGQISLDESMASAWVDPDIKDNPWHKLLTPRINLSHQTGFTNWRRQTDGRLTFQWKPGSQAGYSGEGYEYVAQFAQNKTGHDFTELAEQYIFAPLEMDSTSYIKRDWFTGRIAEPKGPEGEFGEPHIMDSWAASDNVYTTPADYAKFMISVMRNENISDHIATQRFDIKHNDTKVLCSPELLGQEHCPNRIGFALGWSVFSYPGETVIMHGGGDWGERTLGFFVPERQTGVIIFTNGANGMKVIRDVASLLYPDSPFIEFLNFQASN